MWLTLYHIDPKAQNTTQQDTTQREQNTNVFITLITPIKVTTREKGIKREKRKQK
jgi:hypothetical protein